MKLIPSQSRPDRGTLILKTSTLNQRDEVVQTFTAQPMLARRVRSGPWVQCAHRLWYCPYQRLMERGIRLR